MKKFLPPIIIAVVFLTAAAVFFSIYSNGDEVAEQASLSKLGTNNVANFSTINDQTNSLNTEDVAPTIPGKYISYARASYEAAVDSKRIIFFHANWCPTCKQANGDIVTRLGEIPENVVIFKTDYDTETELKKKYGIAYQHTFVQVNAQGNEISKWNGGGLDEIISHLK